MSIDLLRDFFLWCAVLHYIMLLGWFGVFALRRDWLLRLHGRWFRLTDGQFDAIHYGGMALYKLLIFVFALFPWLALTLIG